MTRSIYYSLKLLTNLLTYTYVSCLALLSLILFCIGRYCVGLSRYACGHSLSRSRSRSRNHLHRNGVYAYRNSGVFFRGGGEKHEQT